MSDAKVSVIVPVYNSAKYLDKCFDSLVNQTLEGVEIVVVDDGSKDESPEIIRQYSDKYPGRFVCIRQANSGQAAARNKALKLCTGEFIGFLDSDDYVKYDMFEKLYSKAKETGSDYAACGYADIIHDEEGNEKVLREYAASKPVYKTKDMYFGAIASPFLHIYKREAVINSGVSFPEGLIYEDTAFYLNLIPFVKKPTFIEESLAYRLWHSNSTMTTVSAERVGQIFGVMDASLAFYKEHDLYDEYREEVEYFCVKVLLGTSMQRICSIKDKKERKELLNRTADYIERNFPNFKKNRYCSGGLLNLYLKCFNRHTADLFVFLLKISGKSERKFS